MPYMCLKLSHTISGSPTMSIRFSYNAPRIFCMAFSYSLGITTYPKYCMPLTEPLNALVDHVTCIGVYLPTEPVPACQT